MCGIIGYSGTKNAVPALISGLTSLEYRGYDSAGISVFTTNGIRTIKSKGRIAEIQKKISSVFPSLFSECGIGHTRWATHGEPSDINSHPHSAENVVLVHNGIIENYIGIKNKLIKDGTVFVSETDTEVAAKLIDKKYCLCKDPVKAIREALSEIEGSYAFGILFPEHPGKIFAVRKDSPLIVAKDESGSFIASDITAVLKYTNSFYRLDDSEMAILKGKEIVFLNKDGEKISKVSESVDWNYETATKGGYAHFMKKEIFEQPTAVKNTLSGRIKCGIPDFSETNLSIEKILSCKVIHIVACGTAMHAGLLGKYYIEKYARIPVNVEIASEFRYKDPILNKDDIFIALSQSGETADTLAAIRLAKAFGLYTLSVVNVAGSSAARESDGVIYTLAGPEIAVASTKAYTVQ